MLLVLLGTYKMLKTGCYCWFSFTKLPENKLKQMSTLPAAL